MFTFLLISSAFIYLAMSSWTFGYACAKWISQDYIEGHRREPGYYHGIAWLPGIIWPIYLFFCLFLAKFVRAGERCATMIAKKQRVKVELEEKVRVEQEKIQQEIEHELEIMDAKGLKA